MKNNPVIDAFIKRINRKLKAQQKQLKVASLSQRVDRGQYFTVSTASETYGSIVATNVDIEQLAFSLAMKSPWDDSVAYTVS